MKYRVNTMENSHLHCGSGANNAVFPVSAFSAFHLLRNYNYLIAPGSPEFLSKQLLSSKLVPECALNIPGVEDVPCMSSSAPLVSPQNLFGYASHYNPLVPAENFGAPRSNMVSTCGSLFSQNYRRQRGEKKPIPEEQKDDKYFERRRRNNQAAKKSRDARKHREDQVALRATLLEHENALLKAQLITLREEAMSLRQLLLEKKSVDFSPRSNQL